MIKLRSENRFIRYDRWRGRLILLVVGAYGFGGVSICNNGISFSSSDLGLGLDLLGCRLRYLMRHHNGHARYHEMFLAVRTTCVQRMMSPAPRIPNDDRTIQW